MRITSICPGKVNELKQTAEYLLLSPEARIVKRSRYLQDIEIKSH
jgi:hypothetical protein